MLSSELLFSTKFVDIEERPAHSLPANKNGPSSSSPSILSAATPLLPRYLVLQHLENQVLSFEESAWDRIRAPVPFSPAPPPSNRSACALVEACCDFLLDPITPCALHISSDTTPPVVILDHQDHREPVPPVDDSVARSSAASKAMRWPRADGRRTQEAGLGAGGREWGRRGEGLARGRVGGRAIRTRSGLSRGEELELRDSCRHADLKPTLTRRRSLRVRVESPPPPPPPE